MLKLIGRLWSDEAGFIVSAELILVATIAILSMIVGLSTVSRAVNGELVDVADGFDALNNNPRYAALDRNADDAYAAGDILGPGGL